MKCDYCNNKVLCDNKNPPDNCFDFIFDMDSFSKEEIAIIEKKLNDGTLFSEVTSLKCPNRERVISMDNKNNKEQKPDNCSLCEHYDGTCLLSPKNWEIWRLMEKRRPDWCPLDR